MEAMGTARRRLRRHERQFQVIDDAIHHGSLASPRGLHEGILREKGDDLHPASAFRAALRSPHDTATDHEGSASQSS